MKLSDYEDIYHPSYLNDYYHKNKSDDGWCYKTDLYVISDNNKNAKLIIDENTILDILVVPDFDDNILQLEISSFSFLRADIKNIFAWRVRPNNYRLKGAALKKPDWLSGEKDD
jgi:hypothetical protein